MTGRRDHSSRIFLLCSASVRAEDRLFTRRVAVRIGNYRIFLAIDVVKHRNLLSRNHLTAIITDKLLRAYRCAGCFERDVFYNIITRTYVIVSLNRHCEDRTEVYKRAADRKVNRIVALSEVDDIPFVVANRIGRAVGRDDEARKVGVDDDRRAILVRQGNGKRYFVVHIDKTGNAVEAVCVDRQRACVFNACIVPRSKSVLQERDVTAEVCRRDQRDGSRRYVGAAVGENVFTFFKVQRVNARTFVVGEGIFIKARVDKLVVGTRSSSQFDLVDARDGCIDRNGVAIRNGNVFRLNNGAGLGSYEHLCNQLSTSLTGYGCRTVFGSRRLRDLPFAGVRILRNGGSRAFPHGVAVHAILGLRALLFTRLLLVDAKLEFMEIVICRNRDSRLFHSLAAELTVNRLRAFLVTGGFNVYGVILFRNTLVVRREDNRVEDDHRSLVVGKRHVVGTRLYVN